MARTAVLMHIITKKVERYLALHDLVQHSSHHCSRPFRIKCAPYCATRKDSGGRTELKADDRLGVLRLPRRREWCRHGAGAGAIADQWCTVQSVARGPRAADGRARTACCGGSTNASCTKLFGSNKWPDRYLHHVARLKASRFEPVVADGRTKQLALEPAVVR